MAINGSGVPEGARVLHVSPNTVMSELKKQSQLLPVNLPVLKQLNNQQVEVEIKLAPLEEKPSGPEV